MTDWDFYFSSGWGFALSIIAVASFCFNLYQFTSNRKKKLLYFYSKLEPFGQPVKDFLERSNLNIEIPHLTRFDFRLINSGNVDLKSEDFELPLEFIFSSTVEYLQKEIKDDSIIYDYIEFGPSSIIVKPFLLKSGEEISISGFITSSEIISPKEPRIRIRDFKIFKSSDFEKLESESTDTFWRWLFLLIFMMAQFVLMILTLPEIIETESLLSQVVLAVAFATMAVQTFWLSMNLSFKKKIEKI